MSPAVLAAGLATPAISMALRARHRCRQERVTTGVRPNRTKALQAIYPAGPKDHRILRFNAVSGMRMPTRPTSATRWDNRPVMKRSTGQPPAAAGVVQWFDADQGWGVIDAPEVPGGCFVHFSSIEMPGYRQLRAGRRVRFTLERPGSLQDGCPYRAQAVWPET